MASLKCASQGSLSNHEEELLTGPMADFLVGRERKHWRIHRKLLAHHSLGFEGHVNKRRDNGPAEHLASEDEGIELPEHPPSSFELLIQYLYQGRIRSVPRSQPSEEKYVHATNCHALYLLSTWLQIPALANVSLDAYRFALHSSHLVPDPEELSAIYRACGPENKALKKLMIRIAARQIMDPEVERDIDAYQGLFGSCPEFAVGVLRVIRQESGGMLLSDPNEVGKGCDFHDHEDGGGCDGEVVAELQGLPEPTEFSSPAAKPPRSPRKIRLASSSSDTPRKTDAMPKESIQDSPPRKTPNTTTAAPSDPVEYSPSYPPLPTPSVIGIMKKAPSSTGGSGVDSSRNSPKTNGTEAKVRFRDRSLSSPRDQLPATSASLGSNGHKEILNQTSHEVQPPVRSKTLFWRKNEEQRPKRNAHVRNDDSSISTNPACVTSSTGSNGRGSSQPPLRSSQTATPLKAAQTKDYPKASIGRSPPIRDTRPTTRPVFSPATNWSRSEESTRGGEGGGGRTAQRGKVRGIVKRIDSYSSADGREVT